MEVVLNHEQKPQGVFLPLAEWEQLKHGVNKASELYKLMDELSQKDIFEMDVNEFAAHLAPVAKDAVAKALDQGRYFSYPQAARNCVPLLSMNTRTDRKCLLKSIPKLAKKISSGTFNRKCLYLL